MACSSSSLTTPLFPFPRTLLELTTDHRLLETAVFSAICQTPEKTEGVLPPVVRLVVDYLKVQEEERPFGVFGEKEWADYLGNVPAAPPLPRGIEEIWQGPCPIYPERRISETHMFVYLPATVNGLPLTFNSLGTLLKRYFPEKVTCYHQVRPPVFEKIGEDPMENSCWVMMTNVPLPASGGKSFPPQQEMIANLATKELPSYQVPKALDASVCILTRFARSKMRLFSSVVIRCQDVIETFHQDELETFQVVVGGFSESGFLVNLNLFDVDSVAVAALRKFTSFPTK